MLCIENIIVEWKHDLLCHASACFHEGQVTGIIGDNGCGKTTFLYCLGLLKNCEGQYIYNDKDIDLLSLRQRERFRYEHIFILLQELSLYDDITLKDYIDMMSHHQEENIPFDFPMNKKLKEFSLGEKQLLLLYGGYLQDKDIYLLDEPTASLDQNVKKQMIELFETMKQQGKIIIMITHDKELLENVDCLYEMKNQQLYLLKSSSLSYQNNNQSKLCQMKDMFHIQLHTPRFLHMFFFVLGLSLLLTGVTYVVRVYSQHIHNQIMNEQRQSIVVYSSYEPILTSHHVFIEPYYQYQYQDKEFYLQDIPLTLEHQRTIDNIEYYEFDNRNYITQIYSQLKKKQVGYIIHFSDIYEYSFIIKEIQQAYNLEKIESHYLEKEYRQQLTNQLNIITILENMILLLIVIFLSFIYNHRLLRERSEYIMLLDFIGFSKQQKVILLLGEMIVCLIVSLIISVFYWKQWLGICLFIFMIYKNDFLSLNKEMTSLYRQE